MPGGHFKVDTRKYYTDWAVKLWKLLSQKTVEAVVEGSKRD